MGGEYRVSNPELRWYEQGCVRMNKGEGGVGGMRLLSRKSSGVLALPLRAGRGGWISRVKGQVGQTQCAV